MFKYALMIFARARRTQVDLVMLAIMPLGTLLLEVWMVPNDGLPQSTIGRLVYRHEYAALFTAFACVEEAIRRFCKDWKLFR